jgi:WD40 repeat protein
MELEVESSNKNNALVQQIESLQRRVVQLTHEVSTLSEDKDQLITNARAAIPSISSTQAAGTIVLQLADYDRLRKYGDEALKQRDEIRDLNKKRDLDLKDLRDALKQRDKDKELKEKAIAELKVSNDELQSVKLKLSSLQSSHSTLSAQFEALSKEHALVVQDFTALKSVKENLELQITAYAAQLSNGNVAMVQELNKLTRDLEAEHKLLEESREVAENRRREIHELERQLQALSTSSSLKQQASMTDSSSDKVASYDVAASSISMSHFTSGAVGGVAPAPAPTSSVGSFFSKLTTRAASMAENVVNKVNSAISSSEDTLSSSSGGAVAANIYLPQKHVPTSDVGIPSIFRGKLKVGSSNVTVVKYRNSHNGEIVVGGPDGKVSFWNILSGTKVTEMSPNMSASTKRIEIESMEVLGGGACIVTGCSDGQIRIFDLETKQVRNSLIHSTNTNVIVSSLAVGFPMEFSNPSGTGHNFRNGVLYSGGKDMRICQWDLRDKRRVREFDNKSTVQSISLSSDGYHLAVASKDCSVKLYDVRNGAKLVDVSLLQPSPGSAVSCVSFCYADHSSRLAAAGTDARIRILDGKSLKPVYCSNISRNGTNNEIIPQSTQKPTQLELNHSSFRPSRSGTIMFSPGGNYVAAAGNDGRIYVWSSEVGSFEKDIGNPKISKAKPRSPSTGASSSDAYEEPHAGSQVMAMDWSSDSSSLVSGDSNGVVAFWSL